MSNARDSTLMPAVSVASVQFNLALCYERLDRILDAKEELYQALRKQANFAKAEDRLARLNVNAIKPRQ